MQGAGSVGHLADTSICYAVGWLAGSAAVGNNQATFSVTVLTIAIRLSRPAMWPYL
jgi:hypothetical protein